MIYAENSFQETADRVVFLSDITVSVTTTNDDGSVTNQTLSISNATFGQVGEALLRLCVCVCPRRLTFT